MSRDFTTKNNKDEEVELTILTSNYGINKLCDLESKKAWAEALNLGVKTEDSLFKSLKDQGIWTDKEEKEVKNLQTKIAVNLTMFEEYKKQNKGIEAKNLALNISILRNHLHELVNIKNQAFSYSCEALSSEVRIESFIAYATVYKNKPSEKYWKNYQDFIFDRDSQAAIDSITHYSRLMIDENISTLKELPENVYLIQEKVLTEDLRANFKPLRDEFAKQSKEIALKKKKVTKKATRRTKKKTKASTRKLNR